MPVEIRELVIKATIGQEGQGSSGASSSGAASPGEEMIKACVEKVLEILKEKNER